MLRYLYQLVFCSPDKKQNDDTHLPDTPQMNAQKSPSMIEAIVQNMNPDVVTVAIADSVVPRTDVNSISMSRSFPHFLTVT